MKICASFVFLILLAHFCRADVAGDVLEEINFARTQPRSYAQYLAGRMSAGESRGARSATREAIAFLKNAKPLQPLAFSRALTLGAQSFADEQGARGTVGHRGQDGSRPWDRIAKHGKWTGGAGENITYGIRDPKEIVATLVIDRGVAGRGHRRNIFNRVFNLAGIAFGSHLKFGTMCVIDFAGGFACKPEPDAALPSAGKMFAY